MKTIYSLTILWTLVWQVQLSDAVREGTANTKVMIQRYEREGDFAKAALWHQAAADCLKIISIPMMEIQIRYYLRHGENALVKLNHGELTDIKKRQEHHLKAAQAHWERLETEGTSPKLEAEREKITQFISRWVQIYPNRFYHYGIYPSFFKARQEIFKRRGDYAAALNLEADAAEMCADQYNEITVAYLRGIALNSNAKGTAAEGVKREAISRRTANHLSKVEEDCVTQYEKVQNTHRRRAALLRKLAEGKPAGWHIAAESRSIALPKMKTALTPQQVLRIARTDARLQEHLTAHTSVHEYASFQGFAWFVSYYNHGWGNLGVVLVNDKTGTVLDILNLFPTRN